MSYEAFVNFIYGHLSIQREYYDFKFKLFYTYGGFSQVSEIFNDSSLEVFYQLAEYIENSLEIFT